jgi:enoyl-CoA hydratase
MDVFIALHKHVDDIAGDTENIGAVILRGAGKFFSAGHDLKDIAKGEKPPKPNFQADTIETLANLSQPVITAVEGYCYTGGLELALAGDIIIASESARLADTRAKWALTPVWGISQRLPRRVGKSKAAEMTLTAKTYRGRQGEDMGLCNVCYADEVFEDELQNFVASMVKILGSRCALTKNYYAIQTAYPCKQVWPTRFIKAKASVLMQWNA